jgi:ribosome maturation factor RimP
VSTDQTRDRLAGVLSAPLAEAGLDLEAVELSQAGRRRLLRVAVDKDGGVTLDDVADATREVSRALDSSDVMGEQPYTLEVSSPGTDRPLTLPRHWRRNRGRLVRVSLHDGRSLTGRVLDSDDDRAVLDVDGSPHEVGLGQVAKAKVQVELNRSPDKLDHRPDRSVPAPVEGIDHGEES